MTIRDQYMNELEGLLKEVPEPTRKEWLYDYYIHFQQAVENGQSEEEAARELGDPKLIAGELLLSYRVDQAETNKSFSKLSRAVFATVSLGLFNIIFVLGPYAAVAGVLIALWGSVIGIGLAGIGIAAESFWYDRFSIAQALTFILISTSLSLLLAVGTNALTKAFFKMTLKYLKFNTRLVRGNK